MYNQQYTISSLPFSLAEFKLKALQWAQSFNYVAYYEHNNIPFPHNGFLNFLAVSNSGYLNPNTNPLDILQSARPAANNLLCCILSYDLKNQIEPLHSQHPDYIQFPKVHVFEPEITITYTFDNIVILCYSNLYDNVYKAILETQVGTTISENPVIIETRIPKNQYLAQVEKIKQAIQEGDVYELNYCQEFFAEQVSIDPVSVFAALNTVSPMPFAGFYKVQNKYLVCASPERFLKKSGNILISQPIKGTIRRGKTLAEDKHLKQRLASSEKEVAENMMIMDLVRNDLARCSINGTVKVEEMFKIYAFKQVFQMITTVRSEVLPSTNLIDILRATFPMGSMTGAPKIQALRLIDHFEAFARGLFSGSLGYLLPNGDFDFNVVIRSIQYDKAAKYLSFAVGSAITFDADPENEYEECLLKAQAILRILK